jgi:hypothetical protein
LVFYSFDTSAYINGQRDLLPPRIFSQLWANIEAMIDAGSIRSVDVVKDEIKKRDDDVKAWAAGQSDLFLPLSEDVQLATRDVLAVHRRLVGVGGRRNAADPFVIGLALVHSGKVVTEEKRKNLASPHIPDVCDAMGVEWTNLIGFVDEQGWRW